MKNVVLWLVELYPADAFREESLTTQLVQALVFLKKCVEANYLPSYMIPERNLLVGRLDQTQIRNLTTSLSTLIHEGGCLLLRCEKLRLAMSILYREPAMAEDFRWQRDMVEKLTLFRFNYAADVIQSFHTDKTYQNLVMLLNLIILPDWQELYQQGYSPEAVAALFSERELQLLS